jgi:type I restriction enzyme S subunit
MKEKWEIKKLGDCFDIIRNGANIKQYSNANGYPITRIETTSNDVFNRDKLGYANIYEIDKYKDYVLKNNDILISHINSTKYLGRAVLYEKQKEETIIHGMNLLNLSGINSNILPQFLVYYFKTESYKLQIFKITKKAVNQASFTTTALKAIDIPIPPLPIQKAIVKELDVLHRLKELQERQIVEYDNLAQSTFYSIFGDPIDNEKGWEVKKLGEVCDVVSGTTPKTAEPSYWNGNIKWITPAEIKEDDFYIYDTERKITDKAVNESGLNIFPINTVILSSRAPIGKVAIAGAEMCCNQGFKNLICKDDVINHIFLFYLLKQNTEYLKGLGRGATFKEISKTIVASIKFGLPPLPLQTAFAERIEKIEAQKELVKQGIAETQLLIDYTMDKYFG